MNFFDCSQNRCGPPPFILAASCVNKGVEHAAQCYTHISDTFNYEKILHISKNLKL